MSHSHSNRLYLGRQWGGLLQAGGLVDLQVKGLGRMTQAGDAGQMNVLGVMEGLRNAILTDGLHTAEELSTRLEALQQHLSTPGDKRGTAPAVSSMGAQTDLMLLNQSTKRYPEPTCAVV